MRLLKQNPGILHEYNSTIKNQMQQGIIETAEFSDRLWEHPISASPCCNTRRQGNNKGACCLWCIHLNGPSLNDCLHVGPKMNQNILDILLRFRVHRVAVIADIEKAFLMVTAAKKDRNVLQFLWFKDVCAEQQDLIELRFTRVVVEVPSSPFLLNATIRHHLEKYVTTHPMLVRKLRRSLYVNDLAFGAL